MLIWGIYWSSKIYKLDLTKLFMDNYIKKIFEGNYKDDDLVHSHFVKFSRGEFMGRAMIKARVSKSNWVIDTTSEYAKDLILTLAEKLGSEKTTVSGAIISMFDLDGFDYDERKMAMGARKYMLYDKEMSGDEIIDIINKTQNAFFALSFSVGDTELNIKPKSPKSAKGSGSQKNENKKPKINFIKLKTNDKEIVDNLIFEDDAKGFKKILIQHTIIVDEIVMPETEEKDFSKIREMALKKGKIIRKGVVDDLDYSLETEFEA